MMDEEDKKFQKRLAVLQIEASTMITVGAVLIALGITKLATTLLSDKYPWGGLGFLGMGIGLLLYFVFAVRKEINELQ